MFAAAVAAPVLSLTVPLLTVLLLTSVEGSRVAKSSSVLFV